MLRSSRSGRPWRVYIQFILIYFFCEKEIDKSFSIALTERGASLVKSQCVCCDTEKPELSSVVCTKRRANVAPHARGVRSCVNSE